MSFAPDQIHLDQAIKLWKLDKDIFFHRYVANYIYFVTKNNEELVLRLTPSTHRTQEEVHSELQFIKFLTDKGLETVIPIKSFNNHFVETIAHSDLSFHVCVFVKINGAKTTNEEAISTGLLNKWGAYLGKLHNYSEDFSDLAHSSSRALWKDDSIQVLAEKNNPNAPINIQNKFSETMNWPRSLDTDSKYFGLIHGDLHRGNYFIVDEKIISFDYDDSSKHWFMYDIAACMSSVLKLADTEELRTQILKDFFCGYQSERQIEQDWLNHFESFYKYRLIIVYNWMNAMIAEGRFSDETVKDWQSVEPWYLKNLEREL